MSALYGNFDDFQTDSVDNPAEFKLKTKFYLNNSVDLVMRRIKHRIKRTRDFMAVSTLSNYMKLSEEEKRAQNLARANRYAKEKVTDAVRQISADHMVTLTTRENISDRDQFFKFFTRFIRLVRQKDLINGQLLDRKIKRDYAYVAVPEYQERGAFHMHIAVVGKQDIPLLRACWYVALGGSVSDKKENSLGQVDVQFRQKRFGHETDSFNANKLVNYLTKYITKDFTSDETLGVHRYKVSRSLPKPQIQRQYLLSCWSYGQKGFQDAMIETINIGKFIGLNPDYQLWSRGEDVFIIRGFLNED